MFPRCEIFCLLLLKLIHASTTGPMYYKGIYHLFYQYNPYAAVWGNISWAHSISYDLVNWINFDLALSPEDPFDINGCWSGSTTFLSGEKPVILYTGSDTMNRQFQNLAEPKNLSDLEVMAFYCNQFIHSCMQFLIQYSLQ